MVFGSHPVSGHLLFSGRDTILFNCQSRIFFLVFTKGKHIQKFNIAFNIAFLDDSEILADYSLQVELGSETACLFFFFLWVMQFLTETKT